MSDPRAPDLAALRGQPGEAVAATLRAWEQDSTATVLLLADAALEDADRDPVQARAWLEAADLLQVGAAAQPAVAALLSYAGARVQVATGDLPAAEASIRRAQELWQAAGDTAGQARSWLGLTQVLAMQGRYADAEAAARAAISAWDPPADLYALLAQAGARRNLGTLLYYQERHADALAVVEQAQAQLRDAPPSFVEASPELAPVLAADRAHVELARGNALTFLDQPEAAQAAFEAALRGFDALDDAANRGRAGTNLGRLLLRRGDYAAALRAFDAAARDLLDVDSLLDIPATAPEVERLRVADELLLEHATASLALNLLPEAEAALERAEALFRPAGQEYELAHTLYLRGLAHARLNLPAAPLLAEALALFTGLGNSYWVARTQTALAIEDARTGDVSAAARRLDALLGAPADAGAAPAWDTLSRAEALLLRGHLDADAGEYATARVRALEAAARTQTPLEPDSAPPLPHIALRIYHLLGRADRSAGDVREARRTLSAAVELLDAQRASLPLEELRTAFLDDKTAIYEELVLALLDAPQPATEEVEAAFDAVERARSRALLERLLAAVGPAGDNEAAETNPDLAAARRRLHWLYNELLGESGSRGLTPDLTDALRAGEAAIQRLEWQQSPLLGQAQPVALADFRASLAPDRQAIVYATAGDELLAFVVERAGVQVVRRVGLAADVARAHEELRFQLGRVALGADYLERHAQRLGLRLRAALHDLYRHAFEPLEPLLHAPRLLIVPAGALHGVPFHALWDGACHLLERFEIAVAPSASVATHITRAEPDAVPALPFAGVAIADPAIPAARVEVEAAARYFPEAALYLDGAATRAGLREAARAGILHVATHGLFRSDNPFFSVLKLADGWIDVRELYRLPLEARLVVLSACESGAGLIRPGDEVIGLARGFLAAGARSIVASIWHVHDESAARLMERFYAALAAPAAAAGAPGRAAAALRAAQQAALAEGVPAWYWAPFYVIGD